MSSVVAAFSAEQVHRLTGLTVARLISWDNSGFFQPSFGYENRRSPYSRVYSFEDVVGLRTLNILRTRVSLQHLKKAAARLKAHSGKPWSQLSLYVVNREVHFLNPQTDEIEGTISGQKVFDLPLISVADDMRARAEQLRRRDPATYGKLAQHRHVQGGELIIAGTRIAVSNVLSLAGAGYSKRQIIAEYPDLRPEDVDAALAISGLTQVA